MQVDICYFVGCPDFVKFVEVYPGNSVTPEFVRARAKHHESTDHSIWVNACYFETVKVQEPPKMPHNK